MPTLFQGVGNSNALAHSPIMTESGSDICAQDLWGLVRWHTHAMATDISSDETRAAAPVIVAISGSLRAKSSNTGLLHLAKNVMRDIGSFTLVQDDSITRLPFYNSDLEDPQRTPPEVLAWRDLISQCDGLFIASPEYNFGTTAVLKNAIDWVSRPPGQHALRNKIISLISSSSSTGGRHMIDQYTDVLARLGNVVISEPDGTIVKGAERISPDGTTTDPLIEHLVRSRLDHIARTLTERIP